MFIDIFLETLGMIVLIMAVGYLALTLLHKKAENK